MSDALAQCSGVSEVELAEVLALVAGTDIVELELTFGASRVTVRRSAAVTAPAPLPPGAPPDALSLAIVSPLVGVFHPSVHAGDEVTAGQAIGAIDSLGIPTNVDAPQAGTVEDVLVGDGSPVEYGQPLLVLRRPRA
ncbi:MAG TPA: biotin/lipoyl-containing protein [Chloroflexota bacterium]